MNFLIDRETMPIAGFYGPKELEYESPKGWKAPDYLTDRYYEMIKESGINLISYTEMDYAQNPAAVTRSLQLAEKQGIGMYVMDSGLRADMTVEEMRERMSGYSHYRCFQGIHVCDEPGSPEYGDKKRLLENYYELTRKINSFEDLNAYVNLYAFHPEWIGVNNNTIWLDRPYFEAYVDAYCKGCAAKMLSEDYYIFDAHSVENAAEYYTNLEIMNQYAQKYHIPYWVHIQLGGQWNDGAQRKESVQYYPQPEEVIWNVNTSLAYGAKGIQYFPLLQPHYFAFAPEGEMDFNRNGLITANGEKSMWFDCVKEANAQIRAVGGYLMKMTHKQMIAKGHYAEQNLPDAAASWHELASVELKDGSDQYGAVIGCFEYQGRSAFYVVNNDVKNKQSVVLNFDGTYTIEAVSAGKRETVSENSYMLLLEPAAAVLVVLKG